MLESPHDLRLIFAVNDRPPAPQHGQLMAMRTLCFCSSSRSVRSSIVRACWAKRSCKDSPLACTGSSPVGVDDGLPKASGGGGGVNSPRAPFRADGFCFV